jgi:hypothetical protein
MLMWQAKSRKPLLDSDHENFRSDNDVHAGLDLLAFGISVSSFFVYTIVLSIFANKRKRFPA